MTTREEILKRISIDPNVCFGKPCIRGTHLGVADRGEPGRGCFRVGTAGSLAQLIPEDIRAGPRVRGRDDPRTAIIPIPVEASMP